MGKRKQGKVDPGKVQPVYVSNVPTDMTFVAPVQATPQGDLCDISKTVVDWFASVVGYKAPGVVDSKGLSVRHAGGKDVYALTMTNGVDVQVFSLTAKPYRGYMLFTRSATNAIGQGWASQYPDHASKSPDKGKANYAVKGMVSKALAQVMRADLASLAKHLTVGQTVKVDMD